MTKQDNRSEQRLTKAELRARLVGNSLEHDQEDIEFWRDAGESLRGKTLYELLAQAEAILASVPATHPESQRLILRNGRIERQPKA